MAPSPLKNDRFSNLPMEILILIITYLPLAEAFRFCSLKKDWLFNNLWLHSPHIALDELRFTDIATRNQLQGKSRFRDFTNLLTHRLLSPVLSSFSLSMSYAPILHDNIDKWIEFALSKSVGKLCLDFSDHDRIGFKYPQMLSLPAPEGSDEDEDEDDDENYYRLPRVFYDMGTCVKSLTIKSCGLGIFNFQSFINLSTLTFSRVALQNWKIVHVLTHCPKLERMRLLHCVGLIEVNLCVVGCGLKRLIIQNCLPISLGVQLSLENLEYFEYVGLFVWFHLKGMAKMGEICLDFPPNLVPHSALEMKRYLLGITNTKILTLSGAPLQVMPFEYLLSQRIFPQSRMEQLNLKVSLEAIEVPGILSLLRSCKRLYSLSIFVDFPNKFNDFNLQAAYPQLPDEIWEPKSYQFPRLEAVEVEGFTGKQYEIELLKLLLKICTRLNLLRIEVKEDAENVVPSELLTSVTAEFENIQFASKNVQIIWE